MECCSLRPNAMYVNFKTDCYLHNSMATNWTQRVLTRGL
jgi:hypothetical protein